VSRDPRPHLTQRPQRPQGFLGSARSALIVAVSCSLSFVACGKKGPPLPPLVKLPVAPAELIAARRANTVDLQFTVPSANTDNTRPANVARVDVYAFTGPATVPDADVLRLGTRVASVAVKAPRDPDVTFDPGDPDQSEGDVDPPEGEGLDQGATARVQETLTTPSVARAAAEAIAPTLLVRTYVGVGITTRGRPGPASRRAAVPLVPPPPAPPTPEVTYTEKAVTVQWPAAANEVGYHVYEVPEVNRLTASAEATAIKKPDPPTQEQRLTAMPITGTQYVDPRMTWGATRCYRVRSVEAVGALAVESEASEPACVTLADKFAPAAPRGLQAVASEGVINLIWDANTEPDLDGYYLLRGPAPGDELVPVTTAVIRETAFPDRVPAGMRFVYALQAVDRSGNLSPISVPTEETAR